MLAYQLMMFDYKFSAYGQVKKRCKQGLQGTTKGATKISGLHLKQESHNICGDDYKVPADASICTVHKTANLTSDGESAQMNIKEVDTCEDSNIHIIFVTNKLQCMIQMMWDCVASLRNNNTIVRLFGDQFFCRKTFPM